MLFNGIGVYCQCTTATTNQIIHYSQTHRYILYSTLAFRHQIEHWLVKTCQAPFLDCVGKDVKESYGDNVGTRANYHPRVMDASPAITPECDAAYLRFLFQATCRVIVSRIDGDCSQNGWQLLL